MVSLKIGNKTGVDGYWTLASGRKAFLKGLFQKTVAKAEAVFFIKESCILSCVLGQVFGFENEGI